MAKQKVKNPAKEQFFCICENPVCGGISWIEKSKTFGTVANELLPDGNIKYHNSWLTSSYDAEFFCTEPTCDGDTHLMSIPFSYTDKKLRKKVASMTTKERLNFIERYRMIKSMEEDDKTALFGKI